jgi:hypothetical protein
MMTWSGEESTWLAAVKGKTQSFSGFLCDSFYGTRRRLPGYAIPGKDRALLSHSVWGLAVRRRERHQEVPCSIQVATMGNRGSAVGIATGYGLREPR